MYKISLSSLVVLIILAIAYFNNALNIRFMHEIKMMFGCMFFIWLGSTAYWVYEISQRKKAQKKLGEV